VVRLLMKYLLSKLLSKLRQSIKLSAIKVFNRNKDKYECPVCNYQGYFLDIKADTGFRKNALCPNCGSLERHRLQILVMNNLFKSKDFSKARMLHFAPEKFFEKYFKEKFKEYVTADLYMENVDVKADLTDLPFKDAEYDFVFASHVLEHIKDDLTALSEIRRILKPKGIAILPVPIVAEKTIEYPEPNPFEANHVRAPGFDYYDRYYNYFSYIEKYSSSDFSTKYQAFIYEDRSNWPTQKIPLRKSMTGEKHLEIVPVGFAE